MNEKALVSSALFVTSYLNYCNSLLLGALISFLLKFQLIQITAARIISGTIHVDALRS